MSFWLEDWLGGNESTDGVLTEDVLNASFAALAKQGTTPTHRCDLDGHVLCFDPFGFSRCIYCGASEADTARPS